MRELTEHEINEVNGGVGFYGAALGGAIGAGSAVMQGGNIGNVIGAAALGAVSGFFGGIATASSGFARASFSFYTFETGILSSAAGGS